MSNESQNQTQKQFPQNQSQNNIQLLTEISNLLNTGLDKESLEICIELCENGVNPEALAAVIKELRKNQLKQVS